MPDCPNPVLVGGTGRSGSTVLGRLLGQHPDLFLTRPEEVRFIANDHGLAEALGMRLGPRPTRWKSKAEARLAVKRTKGIWFARPSATGLQTSLSLDDIDALAADYLAGFSRHPVEATQGFVYGVMSRVTQTAGGRRWVDGTPANVRIADLIEPIYPQCQVIAMIRDGRDVAASFITQTFGPNEIFASLRQWEQRTMRIQQATEACRPGRILTIDMLDLVDRARDASLQRICDFLNISVDPQMKAWFDENVTSQKAHVGRWRTQFDEPTTTRIDEVYAEMVDRLTARGIQVPLTA